MNLCERKVFQLSQMTALASLERKIFSHRFSCPLSAQEEPTKVLERSDTDCVLREETKAPVHESKYASCGLSFFLN